MILKINGTDFLPFVAEGGVEVSRNDLDGENAGRTMDGTMYRDRKAIKKKINVTLRDLTTSETMQALTAILPEFVQVEYTDPQEGNVTKPMYSNNVPASVAIVLEDGTEIWTGIKFPLVER